MPQNPELTRALEKFRFDHGAEWDIEVATSETRATLVWGGLIEPPEPAGESSDLIDHAFYYADLAQAIHRLDPTYMVPHGLTHLPLSKIGSTDKVVVRLRQEKHGVPVDRGWLTMLLTPTGSMLAMESVGIPGLTNLDTQPRIPAETAANTALEAYAEHTGLAPTETVEPRLQFSRVAKKNDRRNDPDLRLSWFVTLITDTATQPLTGFSYTVDAINGTILNRETAVHQFDVSGTVETEVTQGLYPHGNPNSIGRDTHPLVDAAVAWTQNGSSGLVYTDTAGAFTIPGITASPPVTVTVRYVGRWCEVENLSTASPDNYFKDQTLENDTGNLILMQPSTVPTQVGPAQANAYYWWNQTRQKILQVNPTDSALDIARADMRVNRSPGGATICNAEYVSQGMRHVVFDLSGNSCYNLSYASSIVHEMAHWLNDRYGIGNPASGLGEGIADVLAMFVTGDPGVQLGLNTSDPDNPIRSGENSRRYCGSKNGPCYHYVTGHNFQDDGWPVAGAFWKMRRRLVDSQGSETAGGLVALTILNSWQNAFGHTDINDNIVIRILNLIDDDNNLRNGTPYYADITRGFAEQGWPDKLPGGITFENLGGISDGQVVESLDPVSISIDIAPQFYPPLTGAELQYRVDGGGFQVVSPSSVVGDRHTFEVPAPAQTPALVEFFFRAEDDAGQKLEHPIQRSVYWDGVPGVANVNLHEVEKLPHIASEGLLRYYVGEKVMIYANDLCSGCESDFEPLPPQDGDLDDEHTWQFGAPTGMGGTTSFEGIVWTDPDSGYLGGTNAWTIDSFPGGLIDPRYPKAFPGILDPPGEATYQNYLKLRPSTHIVKPDVGNRVVLRFRRWLTVKGSFRWVAQVVGQAFEASHILWENHRSIITVDDAWRTVDLDLTSALEASGCVSWIQWSLVGGNDALSDEGEDRLGGWAIDDVELFELRPVTE